MMEDIFKIYIEQLRDGQEKIFDEKLSPDFLDIHDPELTFSHPIELTGTAYLAEQELVLHWDIHTIAEIPCSICNQLSAVPISIKNFYISEPLLDIKSGVYHFKSLLRETVLLEVPSFTECHDGNCPQRKEYTKYLKGTSNSSFKQDDYRPFADLEWKD